MKSEVILGEIKTPCFDAGASGRVSHLSSDVPRTSLIALTRMESPAFQTQLRPRLQSFVPSLYSAHLNHSNYHLVVLCCLGNAQLGAIAACSVHSFGQHISIFSLVYCSSAPPNTFRAKLRRFRHTDEVVRELTL